MKINKRRTITLSKKQSKTLSLSKKNKKSKKKQKKSNVTLKKNKKGGFPSCNDPNYSIFNTNFLSLFPYKPSI